LDAAAPPVASARHQDTQDTRQQDSGQQGGGERDSRPGGTARKGTAPMAPERERPLPPPQMTGDPCTRFNDVRRDYCRQVLQRLMG
jgi:hypothetical protein